MCVAPSARLPCGAATLHLIRGRFGDEAAGIVADCTDSWEESRPPWRARKEAYLGALPAKPARSLLVSLAADETHNAEAILTDFLQLGEPLRDRFSGGGEGTVRYYCGLRDVFAAARPGALSARFSRAAAGFAA